MEVHDISVRLSKSVQYLVRESQASVKSHKCNHYVDPDWVLQLETWGQLEVMRKLLCQRPPATEIPTPILEDIDAVIQYSNQHSILKSSSSITPHQVIQTSEPGSPQIGQTRLSLWKGDITTLTDVTAIVNAANSELLGCFRPEHRCIDNVVHSAAGPRLRDACYSIMREQGHSEPVGCAKVTPGFDLQSPWVLHTVGPQVGPRQMSGQLHREQLAQCYRSCLEAADRLPPMPDGRKVLVFCCISTGLFAFPPAEAASIAVKTVVQWCQDHPSTTLTDIIFDTFLQRDWDLYDNELCSLNESKLFPRLVSQPKTLQDNLEMVSSPAITKARAWLEDADYLIISAGAGLSAAMGLDYTSTNLFSKYFPAFRYLGLNRLYDVFGFTDWESLGQKWGYYFLHMEMVRKWPASRVYKTLRTLADRFEKSRYFVRTSNADGQFVANAFPPERVSTPQGQYKFLQCYAKCRPNSVFPSTPFIDAALPFVDPVTQTLTDELKVPRCTYCGSELTLCVRGGDYFNPAPFRAQERAWAHFRQEMSNRVDGQVSPSGTAVILELGVGLNTPAVLRWPNERLVEDSPRRGYRLIRAGIGASGCAPWELEEDDLAVGINGDIGIILDALVH